MADEADPGSAFRQIANLDDTVHHRVRLAILLVLERHVDCEFRFIRDHLALTDGNLGNHLNVLAGKGLIAHERRPGYAGVRTWVRITPAGKDALARELAALDSIRPSSSAVASG